MAVTKGVALPQFTNDREMRVTGHFKVVRTMAMVSPDGGIHLRLLDEFARLVRTHRRLNKLEKTSPAGDRLGEWEDAHREMHHQLIAACQMPLLLQFCSTLHDLSDRHRRLFLEDHPIDRDVAQEHVDICTATMERRADDACDMLRDHIERTGKNVLRILKDKHGFNVSA